MNRRAITAVKNSLKSLRGAIKAGKKDEAAALAKSFVSTVDKAAKSGRIHRNSANRHKGNVARALAGLS